MSTYDAGKNALTERLTGTPSLALAKENIALRARVAELEAENAKSPYVGMLLAHEDTKRDNARLRTALNAAAEALEGCEMVFRESQMHHTARITLAARDAAREAAKEGA